MKWLAISVVLLLTLAAVPGWAQDPTDQGGELSVGISPGEVSPTPEMWLYQQQLRQYQDPKMAVRRRAEFRADQRQQRLAAQRWAGYSPSRPPAVSDPFNSSLGRYGSTMGRYRLFGDISPVVVLYQPRIAMP